MEYSEPHETRSQDQQDRRVRDQVRATVQALRALEPTATPPPRLAREEVLSFARSHSRFEVEWEAFHTDFDRWRQDLIACDARTMQDTLRGLAGEFAALLERAQGLPRHAFVRELSDRKFVLREEGGLSLNEIASATGVNAETAKRE